MAGKPSVYETDLKLKINKLQSEQLRAFYIVTNYSAHNSKIQDSCFSLLLNKANDVSGSRLIIADENVRGSNLPFLSCSQTTVVLSTIWKDEVWYNRIEFNLIRYRKENEEPNDK